jgi:hypothetical protein
MWANNATGLDRGAAIIAGSACLALFIWVTLVRSESAFGVPLEIHYPAGRLSLAADGVPKNTSEHAG